MYTKMTTTRLLVLVAVLAAIIGGAAITTSAQASAARATCKTLRLDNGGYWWSAVKPKMTVPVCYTGSRIWQNGNITAGVDTGGYELNGIDWAGTYNSGGNWLGAGLNFRVTLFTGWASFSCAARWTVNARGSVTSFTRC